MGKPTLRDAKAFWELQKGINEVIPPRRQEEVQPTPGPHQTPPPTRSEPNPAPTDPPIDLMTPPDARPGTVKPDGLVDHSKRPSTGQSGSDQWPAEQAYMKALGFTWDDPRAATFRNSQDFKDFVAKTGRWKPTVVEYKE